MNNKISKKFFLELEISNNLADIEDYAKSAYYLLTHEDDDEIDKVEIIDCLSYVPSIIKTVEETLEKLVQEYETELEELRCRGGYINEE
jgi:transcriptional regulator CtsR